MLPPSDEDGAEPLREPLWAPRTQLRVPMTLDRVREREALLSAITAPAQRARYQVQATYPLNHPVSKI